MKITNIQVERLRRELNPPFNAAWEPTPRTTFGVDAVLVETDEGITGLAAVTLW